MRAAFLAVVVIAGVLAPAAAAEPRAARLAGTVTLSGTTSGSVPVVVPRTARLGNPFITSMRRSVTIRGGGQLAAFALISDDPDGTRLVGGYSAATRELAARHGAFVLDLGVGSRRTEAGEFVVPAGSYRLHLVPGGKPASVTLRFGGLSGSTSLRPTRRTAAVVHGAAMTGATPLSYSAGHGTRMRAPFLLFSIGSVDLSAHTESVGRSCFYVGRPGGPDPYGPGCASLSEGSSGLDFGSGAAFVVSDEFVGDATYVQYGGTHVRTTDDSEYEGDFGAGFSFTGGALVKHADYAHVWLPL
jgi:hypothetical protein